MSARARRVPRVLSIAGTDPTGGAGIHADLKSIGANGGYGMAVVTAVVAQNTVGVRRAEIVAPDLVLAQLDAVSDDVEIDAVKIGMLGDAATAEVVGSWLDHVRPERVVLDPVMIATSGDRLLAEDAEDAVLALLPRVDVVTPNVPELAALLGEPAAADWAGVLAQAARLSRAHGVLVLAKGGHLDGPEVRDALVGAAPSAGGSGIVRELRAARIATTATHGTGCSLSSAVATLAGASRASRASEWAESVAGATAWLAESIRAADLLDVGAGAGPVSHFAGLWRRGGTHTDQVAVLDQPSATVDWWREISETREAIRRCRFVAGLEDGSLEPERFRWYLAQDARYLGEYARVLATASALAPALDEQAFWAESARGAVDAETALHAAWIGANALLDARLAPTTAGYVDHLLARCAGGSYGEVVAAALPCFQLYADLGARLAEGPEPHPRYASWIATYGDEAFAVSSASAAAIVDRAADASGPELRRPMRDAYVRSSEWELAFFEAPLDLRSAGSARVGAAPAPVPVSRA